MYKNDTGYPSYSDIVRPYIDATYFTEESRYRGEKVHEAIECYLLGLGVPKLQTELERYFLSFRKWADTAIDEVIMVEVRLVDERLGFCGQPDAIIRLKGDQVLSLSLPDWKTSQAYMKSWRLQYAAYRHLAQTKGITVYRGMSSRLKQDGSGCKINEHPKGNADWNYFLSALNTYKFFYGGENESVGRY